MSHKNPHTHLTSNTKIFGDTKHSSIMQRIQNEIRDYIISKQWITITTLHNSFTELQNELEFVKNNLVHTLKRLVNMKKQQQSSHHNNNANRQYNSLVSPPKYSCLQSSFISSGNAIKNRTHRKHNSSVTNVPKLNISGYCPSETQTNTSMYNINNNSQKITDYVNTLYKRNNNHELLNFSQNSILMSTINNANYDSNNTNNVNDTLNISTKKYNLSNSNMQMIDNYQNKTQAYIAVHSSKKNGKKDASTGMKKKSSLTKLSYGSVNSRNYYHRPNNSIGNGISGKICETEYQSGNNNKGVNYNYTVSNTSTTNNNLFTPRTNTKNMKIFGSQSKQSGGGPKLTKIKKVNKL